MTISHRALDGVLAGLRSTMYGEVLGTADSGHDDARKTWNVRIDRRAAVFARGAVQVVDFARAHALHVAVAIDRERPRRPIEPGQG